MRCRASKSLVIGASSLLIAVCVLGCRPSARPDAKPAATISEPTLPDGPYLVVLGTAQDAGLPQIGSRSKNSVRARTEPAFARKVASLLIADPASGKRWLIDATPDLREQVEMAWPHPSTRAKGGPRPALFDGIFLTHAHIGHYSGLVHLGREAYSASRVPIHATQKMCDFLASNGPWDLLVKLENIVLVPLALSAPLALTDTLSVTAIAVPHRAEYTDTVAFLIAGPKRRALYLPDIDKWNKWERDIEEVLATVDIALIDGTFFADGEIPGRAMADIPHPFIVESLARFGPLPAAQRRKIIFTHLNHSNPAADANSAAAARVTAAGMSIARDGQIIEL